MWYVCLVVGNDAKTLTVYFTNKKVLRLFWHQTVQSGPITY